MKKVLIFSLAYYPKHVGGAEVAIKEITDRISPKDIEFHMICLRFDDTLPEVEQVGNVLVHRIGYVKHEPDMSDLKKFPLNLNKFMFQFDAVWKALQLHRTYTYDGIWAMMAHATGVPAGIFKTLKPKVSYLLTLQEGDPIDYIKRKMLPLYPLFVRGFTKADSIQAISTYLGKWAQDMGFLGQVEIIPNAVDVKHFSQTNRESEQIALKQKLGKQNPSIYSGQEESIFLITTSRLVKKNAVDDVIKALVYLPENIHFLILGIGPDEAILRELVKEKRVGERVHFIGQVNKNELPGYLFASDIFIRPSLSEGFGISFVEAMAAELPVIATQEGGISDFLFDRERNPDNTPTGWAVDTRDPGGIVRQVKNILDNPDKTKETVANAKKLVAEKYDWDLIARDMREKIFKKLLK